MGHGPMMERRTDERNARIVSAAVELDTLWGCVAAWHYLRDRAVPRAVALRVLSKRGIRRTTDAQHPAVRDDRERLAAMGIDGRQERTDAGQVHRERTNLAAERAVERAIGLVSTHGRHYAESLLRIQGLDTATVMRVLFEPHRRRRRPA